MARKIFFDTVKEAKAELARKVFNTGLAVRRVPYGRHKGKYVVCSYLGWLNEMYGD